MISNETQIETTTAGFGLSLPPNTIVGYRENGKAIYNVAGGSGEVTGGTDDEDDDDDSSSESDDDDDSTDTSQAKDKWVPPTREDYDKLLAAKAKADSEAAARKRFLRDNNLDPKTGKPITKPSFELEDDDDVTDTTDQKDATPGFNREKFEKQAQRTLEREIAKAERTARSSSYSLIAEVPAALEDAGWNGKNLPRMIKLLDLDAVEVDADGVDVDTLAQQVTELKKDFPEFFKRTRMRDAAKEVADAEAVGGGKKEAPASVDEQDWKARMKQIVRQQGIA